MTKNLEQADLIYQELLDHALDLMERKMPLDAVAAALMAIAQRLYRTHLNDEDYKKIMKVALETYVEPYEWKKGTLH
jgi:hypothetical protein